MAERDQPGQANVSRARSLFSDRYDAAFGTGWGVMLAVGYGGSVEAYGRGETVKAGVYFVATTLGALASVYGYGFWLNKAGSGQGRVAEAERQQIVQPALEPYDPADPRHIFWSRDGRESEQAINRE